MKKLKDKAIFFRLDSAMYNRFVKKVSREYDQTPSSVMRLLILSYVKSEITVTTTVLTSIDLLPEGK